MNQLFQRANADTEKFTYDATGNWTQYATKDMIQTRTHNAANEIVSIDDKKPVVNDKNGNMLRVPKPSSWSESLDLVYDAWNRLVEVKDVATYTYDALNRRVKKIDNDETRLFYYNQAWQCVEEYANGTWDVQYLWSLRYIDNLITWKKDNETFYVMQDANWNVVALANTSGSVVERYNYNAFGQRNVYDASFNAKSTSSYPSFTRSFTGQILDMETGMMLYRNRHYHPTLGRFVQRDPIGYEAEDVNLYRYVRNMVMQFMDALGFQKNDYPESAPGEGNNNNPPPPPAVDCDIYLYGGRTLDTTRFNLEDHLEKPGINFIGIVIPRYNDDKIGPSKRIPGLPGKFYKSDADEIIVRLVEGVLRAYLLSVKLCAECPRRCKKITTHITCDEDVEKRLAATERDVAIDKFVMGKVRAYLRKKKLYLLNESLRGGKDDYFLSQLCRPKIYDCGK